MNLNARNFLTPLPPSGPKREDTVTCYDDPGRGHSTLPPTCSPSSRSSAVYPYSDNGPNLLLPAGPLLPFTAVPCLPPSCSCHALHNWTMSSLPLPMFTFSHLLTLRLSTTQQSICKDPSSPKSLRIPMLHCLFSSPWVENKHPLTSLAPIVDSVSWENRPWLWVFTSSHGPAQDLARSSAQGSIFSNLAPHPSFVLLTWVGPHPAK